MKTAYKEKLIKEIEALPDETMPKLYQAIQNLKTASAHQSKKPKQRGSLKGIWKGSQIDEAWFQEAKKSLFSFENK